MNVNLAVLLDEVVGKGCEPRMIGSAEEVKDAVIVDVKAFYDVR